MHGSTGSRHQFQPNDISHCIAWLRSDWGISLESGKVSAWKSRGPGSNNGDAAQADTAKQPAYGAGINGIPRVTFSGAEAMTWTMNNLAVNARTMVSVLKMGTEPHTGFTIYSHTYAGTFWELLLDLATYQYETFCANFSALTDSVGHDNSLGTSLVHAVIHTHSGGTPNAAANYTAALDGATKTVVQSGAIARISDDKAAIGSRVSAADALAFPFVGDLYELIVYDRALVVAETDRLWGYLKQRYTL